MRIDFLSRDLWINIIGGTIVALGGYFLQGKEGLLSVSGGVIAGILLAALGQKIGERQRTRIYTDSLLEQMVRLEKATESIVKILPTPSHPIGNIIEGWYEQVAVELQAGGPDSFEIDSDYYKACLPKLSKVNGVRAVADLTVDIEDFWKLKPSPQDTFASERIFLLGWKTLFNDRELNKLFDMFKEHQKHYRVRVGCAPDWKRRAHKEFSGDMGYNMLLIPPDLVGGYVIASNGYVRLRIKRSRAIYSFTEKEYAILSSKTVELIEGMDYGDFRRELMKIEEIGKWHEDWNNCEVEDRPANYFDKYELHIRSWIPAYDDFISYCSDIIKSEAVDLVRGKRSEVKILEIGYGTGSLTLPMLPWIESLNERLTAGRRGVAVSYVGIDRAKKKMMPYLAQRLGIDESDRRFEVGRAWEWFPNRFGEVKFDIICGSLVLHDIVAKHAKSENQAPEGNFKQALKEIVSGCEKYLTSHGRIIFADSFTDHHQGKREGQRTAWCAWMKANGLAAEHAEFFLKNNSDMIETLSEVELNDFCTDGDYSYEFAEIGGEWSPFRVLILRRHGKADGEAF